MKLIWLFIFGIAAVIAFPYIFGTSCDGEREWSEVTGVLQWIDVESDECCHCKTLIKFYNKSTIWCYDCDDSLEDLPVNQTYTFYFCPHQEEYATTRGMWESGCFYVQVVDYVEDSQGNVVWGSKWW